MTQVSIIIDESLRYIFFGLECALDVNFIVPEMERVFAETQNKVTEKRYEFYSLRRTVVSGTVEEYEPETLYLRVHGNSKVEQALPAIVENAAYHAFRSRKVRGEDSQGCGLDV